jgi:hypothetical protein
MIGTLGQFVREIRDLLTGSGAPIPVDIGTSIDVSIDNTSIEVSNDSGNPIPVVTGLEIPEHDYIALSYTGNDLTGVTYKTGGSGGTTVATLTLAYSDGKLASVTKS